MKPGFLGVFLFCCAPVVAQTDPNRQETPAVLLPGAYWDEGRQPLKTGEKAPDWTLPVAADSPLAKKGVKTLALGDLTKKKPLVLVFWAFWCDTWKDATHYFGAFRGQNIVAVAVDASQQPVARPAFRDGRLFFPVAIDAQSQTTAAYGVRRVPTVVIVGKNGLICARWEGLPSKKALAKVLKAAS